MLIFSYGPFVCLLIQLLYFFLGPDSRTEKIIEGG
jgi:hypothetical protein